MDYRQISTFLELVELRNMTKVAESMFVSQSTVSYRIKSLEAEVNAELVHRRKGTQNVTITEKGLEFVELAKEWLDINDKIEAFSSRSSNVNIKISAPESINKIHKSRYKKLRNDDSVNLTLETRNSYLIADAIRDEVSDIGFSYIPVEDKNLKCDYMGSIPLVVLALREGYEEVLSLSELDPNKIIKVRGMGLDNENVKELLRKFFGRDYKYVAAYDTLSSIENNIDIGEWAILPDIGLEKYENDDRFLIMQIDGRECYTSYYMITKSNLSKKKRNMIEKYF